MKRQSLVAFAAVFGMVGCSTASKDIAPTYVSPMQYQSYDCEQIAAEAARIQVRVNQLGGRLDEAASNDKAITTASIVLFWPALFFVGGTKQQEAEYARLRGEYDAVQQVAIQKRCQGAVPPGQQVTQTEAPAAQATVAPAVATVPAVAAEQPAVIPAVATEQPAQQ